MAVEAHITIPPGDWTELTASSATNLMIKHLSGDPVILRFTAAAGPAPAASVRDGRPLDAAILSKTALADLTFVATPARVFARTLGEEAVVWYADDGV